MQLTAPRGGGLLAAALALPGLAATVPQLAHAETAPTAPEFALRFAHYQDFQPGDGRMRVNTPSLFVLLPFAEDWAAKAYYTTDSLSGASPLYFNTLSGASGKGIHDIRRAGDVELTRYIGRVSVGVGAAISTENDYDSHALRVRVAVDSEDHNRSWSFGLGGNHDRIDSVNDVADNEKRHVAEAQLGYTQVLSPLALFHASLSYGHGSGYFDDPYKLLDTRPDHRDQAALLLRYNRFFQPTEATLRMSYRYYADSWRIRAHTLEAAWEQPFAEGWALTPSLRYYTQSRAQFYFDPPFATGFEPGHPFSADTRLAAFGAWTAAVDLAAPLKGGWVADAKFAFYQQRSEWRWVGSGSPGLQPFSARLFEVGLRKSF